MTMSSPAWAWPPQKLGWVVLGLLTLWLLLPLANPAHVEGFSASLILLAVDFNQHHLASFDLLHSMNVEYFGLSKLGTVLAIAGLMQLDIPPELAMRLVMWVGDACLLGSCFYLVRRWSGRQTALVLAALLLVPAIGQSTFFDNDNVFATGLALLALVLATATSRWPALLAAGFLFAWAVLARTDLVLIGPALPLVILQRDGVSRLALRNLLVASGMGAVTLCGVLAALQATPLDLLHAGGHAIALWQRGRSESSHFKMVLAFAGIPGLLLMVIGLPRLWRSRPRLDLVLLVGIPLLFNTILLGKIWEARQLLPLAPFVASWVAEGLAWLIATSRGSRSYPLKMALLTIIFLLVALPPVNLRLHDGPRAIIGQLWLPAIWTQWQAAVGADRSALTNLTEALNPHGPSVIITDGWTNDRYVDLALQEQGYGVPSLPTEPACHAAGEQFVKGDSRVIHIRLHEPFVRAFPVLILDRFRQRAQPCIAALPAAAIYLVASPGDALRYFGAAATPAVAYPHGVPFIGTLKNIQLRNTAVFTMTGVRLAELEEAYRVRAWECSISPQFEGLNLKTLGAADAALMSQMAFAGAK